MSELDYIPKLWRPVEKRFLEFRLGREVTEEELDEYLKKRSDYCPECGREY